MKLSVVILNYNVRYFLELCLQSVTQAIKDIDAEIIVVDNNSPDDSCAMVKAQYPNVILIENKENLGFSKANNLGVAKANGEYVCILNPDTVVPEDVFTILLEFADTKTDLGILGCQLIDGTGYFLPESKRNIPSPLVSLKKIIGNGSSYYSNLKTEAIGKVDILVGAFMLIKTSVYKSVDGFDEDYFMYGEDIDLSYKILKKGYSNYYNGSVSIIHFKGESTLKDKTYAKRFYGAMQLFYKKHYSSNIIVNGFVFTAIKIVSAFSLDKKVSSKLVEKSLVFSKRLSNELMAKLLKPVSVISDGSEILPNSLIILDAEQLSYKSIIDIIKMNSKTENLAFRIWPKKSNFTLGSDSAIGRGEVLKF